MFRGMASPNPAGPSTPAAPDRATLRRAIKSLHRVLKRKPEDVRSMVRIARAHRLLGEYQRAARWYKVAIDELSKSGMGLRALGLAKELLAVAPEDHELLLEMARLVARNPGAESHVGRVAVPLDDAQRTVIGHVPREFTATSAKALPILDDPAEVERLDADAASAQPPPPPPDAFEVGDDDILEAVEEQVSAEDGEGRRAIALQRARLGEMPLLASLGQGAAVALMQSMSRIDLEDGTVLCDEGDPARSFYVVAEGRLESVSSRAGAEPSSVELAEGEVAGVFGLYAGRTRRATLRAKGPATVFEVTDRTLTRLVREHPAAKKALARFYRKRLLESFLATAPAFRDLPRDARLAIAGRFRQRIFETRETIVSPGEVVNGLWLVLKGEVVVTTREGGRSVEHGRAGRGQVLGCLSALVGVPTLAVAECASQTAVVALSHRAFAELMTTHPGLKALHRHLSADDAMLAGTLFVVDALSGR